MSEFIQAYYQIFLTAHILTIVVGLGAATVSDILFFRFLQDFKVDASEFKVLGMLKNIIMVSIICIIITGFLLYISDVAGFNASPAFLLKSFIVLTIFINGIALHMWVAPRLLQLDLTKHDPAHTRYRILAFGLGAISVVSWYSAFLLAMLKRYVSFTLTQGLAAFVVLLVVSILGSQLVGWWLSKKAG